MCNIFHFYKYEGWVFGSFYELGRAGPKLQKHPKSLFYGGKSLLYFSLFYTFYKLTCGKLYHMPEFFALSIIVLLFSVILHEVMHGLVALKFGDHTAERAGRLTLNPIPHIDLFGTILLPALLIFTGSPILFGWAKPVPVNPLNFKNLRKGELMVSAAGVVANFALAILATVVFHILNALPQTFPPLLGSLLVFMVKINLVLGIFNLLPIPPLDGSKVLLSQLPYKWAKEYQKFERYGFFILLILLMIPFGSSSILQTILGFLVGIFSSILGF